jgi:DNA modification methylase
VSASPLRFEIVTGDARALLRDLPDGCARCVVTSPPYYGLRDYGVRGQLGLEDTLQEYLDDVVGIFREVRRVLAKDGTLWLNLGDLHSTQPPGKRTVDERPDSPLYNRKRLRESTTITRGTFGGLQRKQLVGLPWRVAFALQADGWILRSEIVWSKRNPMPESVKDRPTRAHEFVFLFARQRFYHYNADAVRERTTGTARPRGAGVNPKARTNERLPSGWDTGESSHHEKRGRYERNGDAVAARVDGEVSARMGRGPGWRSRQNASFSASVSDVVASRNLRSVWDLPTQPFKGAHFATYPEALVEPCILAGTEPGDLVLDPFCGSGTTGLVARRFGRSFLGFELNPEYADLARRRCAAVQTDLRATLRARKPHTNGEVR